MANNKQIREKATREREKREESARCSLEPNGAK